MVAIVVRCLIEPTARSQERMSNCTQRREFPRESLARGTSQVPFQSQYCLLSKNVGHSSSLTVVEWAHCSKAFKMADTNIEEIPIVQKLMEYSLPSPSSQQEQAVRGLIAERDISNIGKTCCRLMLNRFQSGEDHTVEWIWRRI